MADNYLEKHREEYERRKEEWLLRKRHITKHSSRGRTDKPDDEAL